MKRIIKKTVDARVKLDNCEIRFGTLTASAMSTIIEGTILPLTEEAGAAFTPDDSLKAMQMPMLRFDLVSDSGETIPFISGTGVSGKDIHFTAEGEGIPGSFKSLELRNIRFERIKHVDKTEVLAPETVNLSLDEDLVVNKVYYNGETTCISIASRGIPIIGLFEGDKQLPAVNENAYEREAESAQPVERLYTFKGKPSVMKLACKGIRYSRYSSDTVKVPVD